MKTTLLAALLATAIIGAMPACDTFSGNDNDDNSGNRSAHLGKLDGTWQLTHINNEPVNVTAGSQTPTITFSDNGTVGGNTGLNSMSGTYTTQGRYNDNISFSPIATTKMAGDAKAMDLERRYNEALARVDTVRVDGAKLVMKDGDAQVLRFTRAN